MKKKENDDRLPGIGNFGTNSESNSRAGSARPESGRRNNHRNGSRGGDMDAQDKESTIYLRGNEHKDDKQSGYGMDVPSLNIPKNAPSKPPIPAKNSARRDKKRSKNENEGIIKTDLVSDIVCFPDMLV